MLIRESAFKVRLNFRRPALHVPGTIFFLGCEPIANPALKDGIGRFEIFRFTKCEQGLPRGISIAFETGILAPSTIARWNAILIEANTLGDPEDIMTATACVELFREIGNSAPCVRLQNAK